MCLGLPSVQGSRDSLEAPEKYRAPYNHVRMYINLVILIQQLHFSVPQFYKESSSQSTCLTRYYLFSSLGGASRQKVKKIKIKFKINISYVGCNNSASRAS